MNQVVEAQMIRGNATIAPIVITPRHDTSSWSGRKASDLAEADIDRMLSFCDEEAWFLGDRDATHGVSHPSGRNPFHEDFLGGTPYGLWLFSYRQGVRHAAAVRAGATRLPSRYPVAA